MGQDWLAKLKLEWKYIFNVQAQESLQDVLQRYDMVFKEFLKRLEEAGMHLKQEKCTFLMPEVDYLGHKICQEGLQQLSPKYVWQN